MPKPLSSYKLCETQISSRPVTISGGTYSNAVIFFTPKIGDKNIDITTLNCEFIQIIDRGEWGKEEVTDSLVASSTSNRKYREFYFDTDCDSYELKFIPPVGLKLGIIQVYFDIELINFNNSEMPTTHNQINDPNALTNALLAAAPQLAAQIGAQVGTTTTQALANQAAQENGRRSTNAIVDVKPWSGDINNHKIVGSNFTRLQVHLIHLEANQANSRAYLFAGIPDGRDNTKYDHYLDRSDDFITTEVEDQLPIYAWVPANKPLIQMSVSELFP